MRIRRSVSAGEPEYGQGEPSSSDERRDCERGQHECDLEGGRYVRQAPSDFCSEFNEFDAKGLQLLSEFLDRGLEPVEPSLDRGDAGFQTRGLRKLAAAVHLVGHNEKI